MARIVITTFGSSGDLNPFLALGLGLRERGHDVLFAVEECFRPPLEEARFPVRLLTGDPERMLTPYDNEMYGKTLPFASVKVITDHYIVPTLRPKIAELRDACAGADLLVSSAIHFAASAVAELTGIPWVSVALTASVPSAYLQAGQQPFPLPAPLQSRANRFAWSLGERVFRRMVDTPINRVRAEYGLVPRRNLMTTGNLSHLLSALAVSPAFMPRPPDWPPYLRVTGFCFWDTPATWSDPPELAAFLDGARPVVAVSSGSMAPIIQEAFGQFYRTSIEAIQRAGARALVIGAAPGTLPEMLPADVLALPYAPFSRVYPRCAAVIHHGGMGTTAQSLRAGVPTLIVPWGADQFFQGVQVERAGVGRWMQRRSYTSGRAVKVLTSLLREPRYRARAHLIARDIQREDGVATLSAAIEEVLAAQRVHV